MLLQIPLVSGGVGSGPGPVYYLDSTEIWDPALKSWKAGATLPRPMYGLKAANIDNQVLIFGNEY